MRVVLRNLFPFWSTFFCSGPGTSDICRSYQENRARNNDGKQCSATEPNALKSWSNCESSPLCNTFDNDFSLNIISNKHNKLYARLTVKCFVPVAHT